MARILVVDDDDTARAFCRDVLTQAGHTVVEAENGVVALREFRAAPVDVIVCDIYMPEMDGFELLTALRCTKRSIPVIMVSGGMTRG